MHTDDLGGSAPQLCRALVNAFFIVGVVVSIVFSFLPVSNRRVGIQRGFIIITYY